MRSFEGLNQPGVARGLFTDDAVLRLLAWIGDRVRAAGGRITPDGDLFGVPQPIPDRTVDTEARLRPRPRVSAAGPQQASSRCTSATQ